ncbi:hypothetical protein [Kribbella sp. HUAS MG21]|uniref:Uncharacterized protein n=1 Tax=Kribbella sp. HUAS MG21 TaxID=3160966 RepID=A0AAU7TMZ6_9ACTN
MESVAASLTMAAIAFALSAFILHKALPKSFVRLADRLSSGPATVFSLDEVRARATHLLNQLAADLSAADPGAVDRDLYERAGLARSAAERFLDSERLTDVVGALALSRSGLDDLRIATGRSQTRYRLCFFNPLHDEAVNDVGFRLDSGQVSVPACRRCAADVRKGTKKLDAVTGDNGKPYFLGDDVWAVTGYGALVEDLPTAIFRYEQSTS